MTEKPPISDELNQVIANIISLCVSKNNLQLALFSDNYSDFASQKTIIDAFFDVHKQIEEAWAKAWSLGLTVDMISEQLEKLV